MLNDSIKGARELVAGVRQFFEFPRSRLQEGLGGGIDPVFFSMSLLETILKRIQSEEYDCVVNLTHNKLSAHLCSLLKTKLVLGAHYIEGVAHFGSSWFEKLDSMNAAESRHQIEYWCRGVGVESPHRLFLNVPSPEERTSPGKKVVIQALTSDPKKNWPFANWEALIKNLLRKDELLSFDVIGAPSEQGPLRRLSEAFASDHRVRIVACDLKEAFSLIAISDLIVTGDTSIKHLASALGIPILEIALGSSNPGFTGAWTQDSLIVHGRVPCAPCPVRVPCSQMFHQCAEAISGDLIADLAWARLQGDWEPISRLARGLESVGVYRVLRDTEGSWKMENLAKEDKWKTSRFDSPTDYEGSMSGSKEQKKRVPITTPRNSSYY